MSCACMDCGKHERAMPVEAGSENILIAARGQTVAKNMTHGRIISGHGMQGIHSITGTRRRATQNPVSPCHDGLTCLSLFFSSSKTCPRQTLKCKVKNFIGNGKLQNIRLNCRGALPDYFSYASKYWFVLFLIRQS